MGDFEDRRGLVGVARDDQFGIAHALEVFGRPGDPECEISFGLTLNPDLPTWRDFGIHPESITGREADSGAPRASAISCTVSRSSLDPMPRPTETSTARS